MRTNSYYFLTLDIETSTLTENENDKEVPKAVWLSYGYCNLYTIKGERIRTGYYREWNELYDLLEKYSQEFVGSRLLCFVHNLAFEFDFLIKNISKPSKMLTNSAHKVISTTLEDFPQIEFRCTLMLSMHSLRYIGEQLGFQKLSSDYRFILPKDKITIEEKEYCIRDCDVAAKYVVTLIEEFGTLKEIPYTKTGRVRKTFKRIYKEVYKDEPPEWDLMPPENCYEAEVDAFAGGCVFSNPLFTGIVMHHVHSYDITSSYPFAMLSELFPYTICKKDDFSLSDLDKPFWIAKLKFKNIRSKYPWQWLSVSKMKDYDVATSKFFNGKLIYGGWIIRTITNIDFEMIKKTYSFDKVEIIEFYECEKYSELPAPYIETIKIYAEKKYIFKKKLKKCRKGTEEWIKINAEYTLAKNDFNAIYGMSVQKLMQIEYIIDEFFQWKEKEQQYKYKDKHITRNFLYGIYITAYARRNLLNAILLNCPYTFVYCDTDSIKFIGIDTFVNSNKPLPEKYKKIPSLAQLGEFDKDAEYTNFVTYGAKKYAYQEKIYYKVKKIEKHDKLNKNIKRPTRNIFLTVAGLPHYKAGKMKIDNGDSIQDRLYKIDEFIPGIIFKDCKNGHKYITTEYNYDLNDYYEKENIQRNSNSIIEYLKDNNIKSKGGVALYSVDYALDITEADRKYILQEGKHLEKWAKTIMNITTFSRYCDMRYLIA